MWRKVGSFPFQGFSLFFFIFIVSLSLGLHGRGLEYSKAEAAGPLAADAKRLQGSKSVRLGQIKALKPFLRKLPKAAAEIIVKDVVFTDNSFGATTGFGGDNARIEMFYPGGIGGIIVIRPPKALSWNELLDNPKSVEVIFPAKTGLYVISARTWEYKPKDLPPSMRQIFADLFENKTYKLKLRQGISYWQNANFAKAKPLAAPFKLIGFKDAQNFVFTAGLSPNLFDNLIAKRGGSRKPLPSIYGRAYLPPFKTGFGLSKGTQEIELTLALDKDVVRSELSLEGDCLLQIGSKKVPMRLEIALGNSPVASVPYTNFLMNAYFPGPWKKAFGISGLTLSDVRAGFSLDATSSTWSVALRGTNTIRKKNATLGGTAMFLGGKLPIPASLIMAIDDGPNKIGSLSLSELGYLYNRLAKKKDHVKIKSLPPFDLRGKKKGEGPFLRMSLFAKDGSSLNTSVVNEFGFAVSGELWGYKKMWADVKGSLDFSGLFLKGRTRAMKLGGLELAPGLIDLNAAVALKVPSLILEAGSPRLFGKGGKNTLKLHLTKDRQWAQFKTQDAIPGFASDVEIGGKPGRTYLTRAAFRSDFKVKMRDLFTVQIKKAKTQSDLEVKNAATELAGAGKKLTVTKRNLAQARKQAGKDKSNVENALAAAQRDVSSRKKSVKSQKKKAKRLKAKFKKQKKALNPKAIKTGKKYARAKAKLKGMEAALKLSKAALSKLGRGTKAVPVDAHPIVVKADAENAIAFAAHQAAKANLLAQTKINAALTLAVANPKRVITIHSGAIEGKAGKSPSMEFVVNASVDGKRGERRMKYALSTKMMVDTARGMADQFVVKLHQKYAIKL